MRKGSVQFNLEEDYLNQIARRQSILQSVEHIAPMIPWFVKLSVVVYVIGAALVIPFMKMIHGPSAFMLSTWRGWINISFFLPFLFREFAQSPHDNGKMFSIKNLLTVLLAQIFGVLATFCQLIAMRFTYSSHVLLFSGMISVVLLLWKIVKRFINNIDNV